MLDPELGAVDEPRGEGVPGLLHLPGLLLRQGGDVGALGRDVVAPAPLRPELLLLRVGLELGLPDPVAQPADEPRVHEHQLAEPVG